MPGRRKHDTTGSARNHKAMGSGRHRHQKWQFSRSKKRKPPRGGKPDVQT